MTNPSPISPAFHNFMRNGDSREKMDALVIYRAPKANTLPPPRGRLRDLQNRLDSIKAAQRPVEAKLFSQYNKVSGGHVPGGQSLGIERVGDILPVAKADVTPRTLPELAEQPNVIAILPNQKIRLIQPKEINYKSLQKNESKNKLTWGLERLGVPALWDTTKGAKINVAVLDTGVHGDHPALKGRVKDFVVFDPLGRRIESNPSFDAGQHGTHVCGTIAGGKTPDGVSIGVAPEANLVVAACLIGDATLLTLIRAIEWAIGRDADIISMSLGFTYYEPLFAEVFRDLIEKYGVLPIVAIGNENHGNTSSPGSAHNALSVGALESMPRGKVDVASFSSGASLVFPGEEVALVTKPDVVAPGVQVYSCIPPERRNGKDYEYTYMDGTSMATPHVAGVAALLMAAKPDAPVATIAQALRDTAEHPSGKEKTPDNRWGYGMIRPAEALKVL
ncbi:S8 family serine peptidase [Polyangium jinanense]|uniref:S8 family serine peptidase n=1 Tax=Polyangium jinanense TaxID=2829994 RepID=A0A9X3X0P1_9BACT|nr:S8 family serine peptidase [Polyangium jinanense]MDC3952781.1 S8 family serine peptidase [Polyangium jinanense]MDC3980400.1 S8 family serine peptidase [Polyangium jinanense]